MEKLIQKIGWNLPNLESTQLYVYGEANVNANLVMQKPLEKLYKYENQPDMREKIKEYIKELNAEIDRLERDLEKQMIFNVDANKVAMTELRMKTLIEVINDLNGRLKEVI